MLRLRPHYLPEPFDVLPLRRFGADGNSYHPTPVELRRRQPGRTRGIDPAAPAERMAVERLALDSGRLVAHADGLQRHRRESTPVGRCVHLRLQPLRIVEIALQASLQTLDT